MSRSAMTARRKRHSRLWLAALLAAGLVSGCGTLKTLGRVNGGGPLVFGGTDLDLVGIRANPLTLERYRVEYGLMPPVRPWLDLPLSLAADTVCLPITIPIEIYRAAAGY